MTSCVSYLMKNAARVNASSGFYLSPNTTELNGVKDRWWHQ